MQRNKGKETSQDRIHTTQRKKNSCLCSKIMNRGEK